MVEGQGPGDELPIESLSLEELLEPVAGASLFEQPQREAPASVTVLTRKQIDRLGYRTLTDVLQGVNGFFSTGDRAYTYAGLRGFAIPGDYNTRILVLVDGHAVNDPVFDSWTSERAILPVDLFFVDKIEVIRGPSSSLYGSNAFFGVINIVTRPFAKEEHNAQLATELGSLGHRQIWMGLRKKIFPGFGVTIRGTYGRRDGEKILYFPEFSDDSESSGFVRDLDGESWGTVFLSLDGPNFRLRSALNGRAKQYPTAAYGVAFGDDRAHTVETIGFVDATYDIEVAETTRLHLRGFFDGYGYDGTYPTPESSSEAPPTIVANLDEVRGNAVGGELRLDTRLSDRLRLITGCSLRHRFRLIQKNFDLGTETSYVDRTDDTLLGAAFAQVEMQILDSLRLNAGGRYDHYFDTFGGTLNPRLAILIDATDTTTLKLLYGRAFREPNVYERFYEATTAVRNPDLGPEHISTYEIAVSHRLLAQLSIGLSGYLFRIDDLVALRSVESEGGESDSDVVRFENAETVEGLGLEAELEGRFADAWFKISYALQRAREVSLGARLVNSPGSILKGLLSVPIGDGGFFMSTEGVFETGRKTYRDFETEPSLIWNLGLLKEDLIEGVDLSMSIRNVLDTRRQDPASLDHRQAFIEQDGRTFFVRVSAGL